MDFYRFDLCDGCDVTYPVGCGYEKHHCWRRVQGALTGVGHALGIGCMHSSQSLAWHAVAALSRCNEGIEILGVVFAVDGISGFPTRW